MAQRWEIINLDRRERSKHAGGELGTWFFYPQEQLLTQLSIPCLPKEIDHWLAEGAFRSPRGPISKLPVEMIDLLFKQLSALHDVINFSITCKSLLAIGKRHILRATSEHYAPWAGCRLVSLGELTPSLDDLPEGLLTPAERKEIEVTEIPSLCEFGEYDRSLGNFANEFYTHVFSINWRMDRINAASRLADQLRRPPPADDGMHAAARARDAKMFSTLYGDGRRATYPEGTRVLCNISKGEYVRQDGLTVPNYVNLVHALLARICWSSTADVGMIQQDDFQDVLTRGSWAGDRFCITTLESLPDLITGVKMAWKDVTSDVRELLSEVWQKNGFRWIIYCQKNRPRTRPHNSRE
ncbi:hypothetical protein C8Q80DRAFT_1268458 [Daedaleopsis nitida]|nr:hypothetical protein C8Q80DRAFT_1268458 [Daedaleopsis nitida]